MPAPEPADLTLPALLVRPGLAWAGGKMSSITFRRVKNNRLCAARYIWASPL